MLNRFSKVHVVGTLIVVFVTDSACLGRGDCRLVSCKLASGSHVFPRQLSCVYLDYLVSFKSMVHLAFLILRRIIFPPFLFPVTAIGYIYSLASGYLNTGRDLRRMESNTRSPIFSGFSELLEGIVTVRAFSAETRFLNDLHNMIDLTTKVCSH
jgi:ABC-type multidrug transport system fused ATPase/permease subunit